MARTKNQNYVLAEGGLWAIYDAFTAIFLTAFALALGASSTVIGIIGSIPYIAIVLAEMPGAKIVEFMSRKTITVITSAFGRLLWIGIALIPYLFKESPLAFVLCFYFLSRFVGYLSDPSWTSLVADVVPAKTRGEFFGIRYRLIGIASTVAFVLGGLYLDIFPKGDLFGFSSLFAAGIAVGLASVYMMSRIKEPIYPDHTRHRIKEFFTLKGELKTLAWIMALFNFAVFIASPLFAVYMLRELGMSYSFFAVASAIAVVAKIASYRHLGKLSDRLGDKPVAFISMLGTAVVPLIYLFVTKQNIWMIVPAQILSGIVWAGADITCLNLLLDFTNKKRRAFEVAEYQIFTTFPIIIASVLGGIIADNFVFILSGIPLVFAITIVLRVLSSLMVLKLKEPRVKKDYPLSYVFREMTVHPIKGFEQRVRFVVSRFASLK